MKQTKFLHVMLLAAGMILADCSSDDVQDMPNQAQNDMQPTWRVSINAGQADRSKRAISIGGNSGKRLYTNWDDSDEVEVVSNGAVVGTLTACITGNNTAFAQLDGTLTGTYTVGDAVKLYNHRAALDYSQQLGTVADVSTNCAYLSGESTVMAVDAAGGFLKMSDAAFNHMQAFLELTFTDASSTPLDVELLNIYTSSGKLVLTKAIDGTTTYANKMNCMRVSPVSVMSNFFLALRNENGASDTYTFIVQAGPSTYGGTVTANLLNGHYYRGMVKLSTGELDDLYAHTDYGEAEGWLSDVTEEINRDFYGEGIDWRSTADGRGGRLSYGTVNEL